MDRPQVIGTLPYFLSEPHKSTDVKDRLDEIRAAAPDFDIEYFDESSQPARWFSCGCRSYRHDRLGSGCLRRGEAVEVAAYLERRVEHTMYPELINSPVVITCIKGNAGIPMAELP